MRVGEAEGDPEGDGRRTLTNGWESRLWRLEDKHLREGSSVRQFGRRRPLRIRHRRRIYPLQYMDYDNYITIKKRLLSETYEFLFTCHKSDDKSCLTVTKNLYSVPSHAHKHTVMDLKWHHNGNWMLTASRDHLLKLFDTRNLKEELQTFKGHKREATGNWQGLLADVGS